jgi:hypothetical protein
MLDELFSGHSYVPGDLAQEYGRNIASGMERNGRDATISVTVSPV